MNHDCVGNVSVSFIGDMLIVRASRDLPVDTELIHSYVGYGASYRERQEMLQSMYGFQCQCPMCQAEINTSNKKKKKRARMIDKFLQNSKSDEAVSLTTHYDVLDELEGTYSSAASEEPRTPSSL